MKKIVSLFFCLGIIIAVNGQVKWKEMDEFHKVMSQTFHPSEEGKLEPIRARSQEMLDKARTWQNSVAPEGVDRKAVKKSLKQLVKGAEELNSMVKANAADAAIKEKLSALHNVFHTIMEKCEKEDHHM
jgi:hypothetical protein